MEGFTKGGFGPPCCRGATPPSDVQCFALLCVGYEQTDKTAPEKKKMKRTCGGYRNCCPGRVPVKDESLDGGGEESGEAKRGRND